MSKKRLSVIITSILILLAAGQFSNAHTVSAANHKIFIPSSTYIYNHKGKKTKKAYKNGKTVNYTSIKKIRGQKFYRIGKDKYVIISHVFVVGNDNNKKPSNENKKIDRSKNAASLMDFIANDASLTSSQRQEAQKAAVLLRTGKIDDQAQKDAPSWFNECVDLGAEKDATNSANILVSIQGLSNVNKVRTEAGVGELKVSPTSLVISMIDADYQKTHEFDHPLFYGYHFNRENLALGGEPVSIWMTEKADWEWDVQKSPNLAPYEFTPNWKALDYQDAVQGLRGFKTAGHYTNLVDRTYRVMGLARIKDIELDYTAYNATSQGEDGAITLEQYKAIVDQWLKK